MRHVNIEDQYALFIDCNDGYSPSRFNLIIKSGELVIIGEDGRNYWFLIRSMKDFESFIEDQVKKNNYTNSLKDVWVEDFNGNKIPVERVTTQGAPIKKKAKAEVY